MSTRLYPENYSQNFHLISSNFFLLRLQNCRLNNEFTDIIIKVGDREFPAHRIVVSNSYFYGFRDLSKTVFELDKEYVHPEIVEDLLTFSYTHTITLRMNTVHLLLLASSHLKIKPLLSACEQFFTKRFPFDKILNWLKLSMKYELKNVKNVCLGHIIDHISEGNNLQEFEKEVFKLTAEDFYLFVCELQLARAKLKDSPVYDLLLEKIFQTVIQWFGVNKSLFLSRFLRKIQSSSRIFYRNCIFQQDSISAHPCSKFLMETLKKLLNYSELLEFGSKLPNSNSFDSPNAHLIWNSTSSTPQLYQLPNGFIKSKSFTESKTANQCGTVIGGKVYLFGGKNIDGVTGESWRIDLFNSSSSELASMPYESQHCAAAACNGFIYVTGGFHDEMTVYSEAVRYNIQTNRWTTIKPMNFARWGHQMVELNGRLYAIGGFVFKPNNRRQTLRWYNDKELQEALKKVEEYNPLTDEWRPVASCNYYHNYELQSYYNKPSATTFCGRIYVCSDVGFEVYSPESNSWKKLAVSDVIKGVSTLKAIGGQLFALGSDVHLYNAEKDRWELQANLRYGRPDIQLCSLVVKWGQ